MEAAILPLLYYGGGGFVPWVPLFSPKSPLRGGLAGRFNLSVPLLRGKARVDGGPLPMQFSVGSVREDQAMLERLGGHFIVNLARGTEDGSPNQASNPSGPKGAEGANLGPTGSDPLAKTDHVPSGSGKVSSSFFYGRLVALPAILCEHNVGGKLEVRCKLNPSYASITRVFPCGELDFG